ncbi:dihydrolipoyl dehydrogenase [Chakrabartyella piscis]|uniref:dihydrolipoyl dehydrogenase n=1 Tax=Chakrabartyella piscis TaxID=2918914 RepID=UPI0029588B27|nr:dihydrolipoyl dehydrogenase [Chakrabartyella piscis]
MKKFDVIVIGGGPGGYVAAIKASLLGKKVAVVEREALGGTCLNWGCIPTKALLRSSELIHHLTDGDEFGYSLDTKSIQIDYAKIQKRSRKVSEKLVGGVGYLMKKNKITVLQDTASFKDKKTLVLQKSGEEVTADSIIIATGTKPMRLPGMDFESPRVLDSKKALQLTTLPKSAVVIGAGAIGMEFAALWNTLGAEVTVAEMLPRILPNEDFDTSKEMETQYKKQGIKVKTETKVTKVTAQADKVVIVMEDKAGKTETVNCDYLLVAAGIVPDNSALALDKAGVKTNQRGYIEINDFMQTNVAGIYAIGDITGKLALAHTASAQGILAAEHLSGHETKPINYVNIPKCTYGTPETASAGLTEQQAKDKKIEYTTAMFPFSASGKALAYGATEGYVKIVSGKEDGELLGVHMVGAHVTEMIAGVVGLLGLECTIEELSRTIHPHPSMSEAIMEASHVAEGMGIHI